MIHTKPQTCRGDKDCISFICKLDLKRQECPTYRIQSMKREPAELSCSKFPSRASYIGQKRTTTPDTHLYLPLFVADGVISQEDWLC